MEAKFKRFLMQKLFQKVGRIIKHDHSLPGENKTNKTIQDVEQGKRNFDYKHTRHTDIKVLANIRQ